MNEYWRQREEQAQAEYALTEEQYAEQLNSIYDYMLDQVKKEINGFYSKYMSAENITYAEATKRVAELDIEEYERKAKKYVEEKNFSAQANKEMRLYNATMNINRLELLKANIGLEMVSNFDELNKVMGEGLTERALQEMARQAGILGATIKDNAKMANSIVGASFHNATFSDRIWMYQDQLKAELETLLRQGLIQGRNPNELARHINNLFDTGKYNCERLLRTELARVQSEAQMRSFTENGFGMYQFNALGTACPVCRALDGKHFRVADMMPGENAAPLHPSCRCTESAWMDDAAFNEWLDSYADHGMSYQDWLENREFTYNENGGKIYSTIESRNSGRGKPSAILHYGEELNKRQQKLLGTLPEYDSRISVQRNDVSMADLSALTAATGDEFALFTKGSERLVVRGNHISVNITAEEAKNLATQGYTWSGHTHPGTGLGCLIASKGDLDILRCFNQSRSSIYDSAGRHREFRGR